MVWLAFHMDDGLLRTGPTRAALVKWYVGEHCATASMVRRHKFRSGDYEYSLHEPGAERGSNVWILTLERATRARFDTSQQPLYPYPDDPYKRVERDGDEDGS
jgi:hypothetical protein